MISALQTSRDELAVEEKELLDMAKAGARALWSLSESRHNKELMRKSGIVPLMGRLLKSVHIELVVPIMVKLSKIIIKSVTSLNIHIYREQFNNAHHKAAIN